MDGSDEVTVPPAAKPASLKSFFAPASVALIGASEAPGSVGRTLLWNLVSNPFGGAVYPVNPRRSHVLGIKAYKNIGAISEQVELALIATPAPTISGIIDECIAAGVRAAVVISAGFKECGAQGLQLEQQILEKARAGNMRVIGPNCLGVMCPITGLNATFASAMARPGRVAFISQSGALCTAVLDWSLREDVGFSAFVSVGSMVDVGWGDLIDYLNHDPRTESILLYMESVGNARAFLSAAREAALAKPIIVIKVGRTEAAAQAAASHTGSLTGSDEVLDAAFRRSGILRVDAIADLFSTADVLAKQPRPRGRRLTILTNAGGPGALATDTLVVGGGELAQLAPVTIHALAELLPAHWSHGNPIDVLGDADPARYAKAAAIASADPNSDGLLVILTPQAMTDPTQTAEQLKSLPQAGNRPLLASWMGGANVEAGRSILNHAGIPSFSYPDTAARVFNYLWHYSYNLRGLYETPSLPEAAADDAPRRDVAEGIISTARSARRSLLTEYESKQLLAAYGIPTVETRIAATPEAAMQHANELGYPVVLKLHSETVTHKTDVGGVHLNLPDDTAVRAAFAAIEAGVAHLPAEEKPFLGVTVQPMVDVAGYELILGCSVDPQFGPVLLFGAGGQLVEVLRDRALALPPLNSVLACRLMEQTRICKALQGIRGRAPVDMVALEQLLVRFSLLVAEQHWVKEIDINPLLASPERLLALDARIILHDPDTTEKQIPPLAIRPYPAQYITEWALNDGRPVTLRPIRPEDEPLMVQFHRTLSNRSVYYRYFGAVNLDYRVSHERLARVCYNDYDREIALVADHHDAVTGSHEILGVGRLIRASGTGDAEFAIVVSDKAQHQGLGTHFLERLIDIGKAEGVQRIVAEILPENVEMQRLCESFGFQLRKVDDNEVLAELQLSISDARQGNVKDD